MIDNGMGVPRSLKRTRISDQLKTELAELILTGQLRAGDKLPTEAALCQTYNVSRSAVREAIASLRAENLVKTRQGVGAFVAERSEQDTFSIDIDHLQSLTEIRKILELRLEVDCAGAAMAARRRSRAQLVVLEASCAALISALRLGNGGSDEMMRFRHAIAGATGNSYFRGLMQFLNDMIAVAIAKETMLAPYNYASRKEIIIEITELMDALRIGDPDRARRASWRHLLNAADRMGLRGLQGWEETRMTSIGETDIPFCAPADPSTRKPDFIVPPKACDCHAHIIGKEAHYPFTPHRSYTPPEASLEMYFSMLNTLGIERGVIVQPSVYGVDNRCTLDAVRAAPDRLRAVVVVDESITERELEDMHAAGARGVRLNLLFRSGIEVSDVRLIAEKVAPFGWHLQMLIDVSEFSDLRETFGSLPVETVFDHMGHMPTSAGVDHQGFQDMLALIADGKAWAKLSGSYRTTSEERTPYKDIAPFAKAIIKANPERCVWASDWPHPSIKVPMPNDGSLLDMLADWCPDETMRNRILSDNPARLYGFS